MRVVLAELPFTVIPNKEGFRIRGIDVRDKRSPGHLDSSPLTSTLSIPVTTLTFQKNIPFEGRRVQGRRKKQENLSITSSSGLGPLVEDDVLDGEGEGLDHGALVFSGDA